jgi:hypothetical protein
MPYTLHAEKSCAMQANNMVVDRNFAASAKI